MAIRPMNTNGASIERIHTWIARGQQGDEAACAALFHAFSLAILRLALGLLGDVQDAEEVLQDTFVYAFQHLVDYRAEKSAFATWLYTIAVSRCRNKRRRRWFTLIPLDQLASQPGAPQRDVERRLERRGVRREVWAALLALPDSLREAVVLRYLAGLRYAEVGQALDCHPKTAESRVRAGLARLRQALRARDVEAEVLELLA